MRIDDENKVVWCDEPLFNEITKLKKNIGFFSIVGLFQVLWEYQKDYPEIQKFLWSHEKDIWTNDEEPSIYDDQYNQILMVKIWSNEYQFKLEQPKKYYWRKKKEHLAWFEDFEQVLIMSKNNIVVKFGNISSYDNRYFQGKFTEQEARDLLKDDFDMFERVEVD